MKEEGCTKGARRVYEGCTKKGVRRVRKGKGAEDLEQGGVAVVFFRRTDVALKEECLDM